MATRPEHPVVIESLAREQIWECKAHLAAELESLAPEAGLVLILTSPGVVDGAGLQLLAALARHLAVGDEGTRLRIEDVGGGLSAALAEWGLRGPDWRPLAAALAAVEAPAPASGAAA